MQRRRKLKLRCQKRNGNEKEQEDNQKEEPKAIEAGTLEEVAKENQNKVEQDSDRTKRKDEVPGVADQSNKPLHKNAE